MASHLAQLEALLQQAAGADTLEEEALAGLPGAMDVAVAALQETVAAAGGLDPALRQRVEEAVLEISRVRAVVLAAKSRVLQQRQSENRRVQSFKEANVDTTAQRHQALSRKA